MNNLSQPHVNLPPEVMVAAGEDQFGEYRSIGIGYIAFKVTSPDPKGLFIAEATLHKKGGPARHLHLDQDEWFYVAEGEFVLEMGQERMKLNPGDSVFGPRKVPHVWAFVGDTRGRILFVFLPAGKMEAFFRKISEANAPAPQDPERWRAYGMELVGPPLLIE